MSRLPIPQPEPSVNVLQSRLNINTKRDITAVLSGPAAGNLLDDKFMRGLNGERSRLMSKNMPVSAPKPGEMSVPGLFNDMAYHASLPNAPGEPRRAAPTSISVTEPQTNVRTPVVRILHAPMNGSMQDLPSRNELLFLKKTRETDTTDFIVNRAKKGITNLDSYMSKDQNVRVNTRPLLGLNSVALMQHSFEQFKVLAGTDTARYRRLTMREWWQGVPDLSWTGWTLDSAVTLEMDAASHSTADGDQYSNSKYNNQLLRPGYNNETKILTCGLAGQHELADAWASRGVQEGASLWIVGKKYDPSSGLGGNNTVSFVKSRKARVLELSVDTARATVNLVKLPGAAAAPAADKTVLAPGLFFVANPTGGELDPSFAEYVDEWGDIQMGFILPVGRVLFLPPHFKQAQPPIIDSTSPFMRAFTDSTEMMVRENLTVLLHTNKDGMLGAY